MILSIIAIIFSFLVISLLTSLIKRGSIVVEGESMICGPLMELTIVIIIFCWAVIWVKVLNIGGFYNV